jgi:hypothetical protein
MENENLPSPVSQDNLPAPAPVPALPPGEDRAPEASKELSREEKRTLILIGLVLFVFLLMIVVSVWYLVQPTTNTARVRDIFIIFMAVTSIFTSLVLVVLMVQLARLSNLLQNEIKPILDSLNETISSLRGTTVFLSDNLTEPVIKLNEYMAGLSQFFMAVGLFRKSSRNKSSKGE